MLNRHVQTHQSISRPSPRPHRHSTSTRPGPVPAHLVVTTNASPPKLVVAGEHKDPRPANPQRHRNLNAAGKPITITLRAIQRSYHRLHDACFVVGNQAKVNAETYFSTIKDCRTAQNTSGRAREMRCSVLFDTPLISRGSERAESVLVVPGIRSGGLLFGDFCLCRGWRIAWEVSAS